MCVCVCVCVCVCACVCVCVCVCAGNAPILISCSSVKKFTPKVCVFYLFDSHHTRYMYMHMYNYYNDMHNYYITCSVYNMHVGMDAMYNYYIEPSYIHIHHKLTLYMYICCEYINHHALKYAWNFKCSLIHYNVCMYI